MLLYLAIQAFTWADGTDKAVVENCFGLTYNDWMSLFISSLQISIKKHINIKRYIIKVSRFNIAINQYINIIDINCYIQRSLSLFFKINQYVYTTYMEILKQ